MSPIRLTHATALILQALASGSRHGFQIMDVTELPSGTVYPVLRRLEREDAVASEWEDTEEASAAGRRQPVGAAPRHDVQPGVHRGPSLRHVLVASGAFRHRW